MRGRSRFLVSWTMKIPFLIVGSGLFGSVIAQRLKENHKDVLVLERRNHLAGNVFTEEESGIQVHKYGAHIFHTNNQRVWNYLNRFASFNGFRNSPIANYKGRLFNLPFNMNTFHALWGVSSPNQAREIIEKQRQEFLGRTPQNLEEQAICLVGRDIYELLIKGYTEKQWGRTCKELPTFIIRRIPVRFTYDNNYFNARYQGIPTEGYTSLVKNLLSGIDTWTNKDFLNEREYFFSIAEKIIFTGPIDEYFDYCYGPLEYRSLKFDTQKLATSNYQGVAVMNFTDAETPYTRIIEHKHFSPTDTDFTIISREYPATWKQGIEPYYPVNDEKNNALYEKYLKLAQKENKVHFGGRLGQYKYFDMDRTVEEALKLSDLLLE